MPVLALGGCAGIGLVWGWLLGNLEGPISRLCRTVFAPALASLFLAGQVWWFQRWPGLICFGVSALASLFLHAGWRGSLRRRFPLVNPPA